MFQTMDPARIITVYVLQLGLGIVYLILGLTIIKRDRKRLNQIFSAFFFSMFFGALLNVIYAPLTINPAVYVLHIFTYFFMLLTQVYLLVFNLILLKSEKVLTTKKQILIIGVFAILLMGSAFIPGGITIDASTNWKPVWSLTLLLYLIILLSCYTIIPTIYFYFQIYNKFEDEELKKRWKYFGLGLIIYYIFSYLLPLSNCLNIQAFRDIVSVIGLLLLPTAILLYYGVGRQIKK